MPPYRHLHGPVAWHQRLNARVVVGITLIVGVALAAVLGATGQVITDTSLARSRDDMSAARGAFQRLVETRANAATAQTRLVVDLPIFRAMIGQNPGQIIDGQTIQSLAADYCQKLAATFCVVTDAAGQSTARTNGVPESTKAAAAIARLTVGARGGRSTRDVVATDTDLFLIVSEPAMFAEEVLGTFTVAYRLDNDTARELAAIARCEVSFICGTHVCGTSLGRAEESELNDMLHRNPDALGAVDAPPERHRIGPGAFVGGLYALKANASNEAKLALLQNWAPTAAAIAQADVALAGIGLVALAVALVGGLAFSRRLTQPLRELATAADELAGGALGRSVAPTGPVETQTMAEAFNHMASSIAHWHDEADQRARRLAETYERFRSVSDSANDAIISANTQGDILFWNRRAQAVFGYAEDDALGRPLAMLFPKRHVHELEEALAALTGAASDNGGTIELHGVRRDGSEVPIELSLSTWKVNGALCYTAVIRDITERRHAAEALKQRDDELRQAQKMEAVGRLAGGVAHDFNNLLTAILGYADLLLDKLPADDPNRRQIVEIQKAGRSAASLTRSLLAFSRKQVLQPVVLNLNAVVMNSENLLRRLIGENIDLVTSLEPSIAAVKADPAQIEQLLVNLAVNARDAMPSGGRLTIATVNLDLATTRQHVPTATSASAALVVRDTGLGMSEEVQAHIFEPFFTTKGPGHGTGLGLASVYGAVKQSGGHVWVESAPGDGATFTVCLPAVAAMPERTPPASDEDHALLFRGTETVLLVEDNEAVRELARETLTGYGYRVVEAANGKEAIRVASQNLDAIAIVVTDVVMPLMGGAELAVRLRTMRPDLKFIFASGYASDPVPGPPASSPGAAFLQKPFTPSALGRTVREVLDAGTTVTAH